MIHHIYIRMRFELARHEDWREALIYRHLYTTQEKTTKEVGWTMKPAGALYLLIYYLCQFAWIHKKHRLIHTLLLAQQLLRNNVLFEQHTHNYLRSPKRTCDISTDSWN